MTFADYWLKLVDRNPGLRDPASKMTISVESFRRSMEQAYERGREQGADTKSLFEKVFGGR